MSPHFYIICIETDIRVQIDEIVNENKDRRGFACIISNEYFGKEDQIALPGASNDSEKMDVAFKHVNFATIVRPNAEKIELEGPLFNAFFGYSYPEAYDCFAIVFSGHGESGVIKSNDGNSVEMEQLIANLIESKKFNFPVLLFIDACRLGDYKEFVRPARLKLFLAYSTANRCFSFRAKGQGAHWIQELAKVIGELRTPTRIIDIVSSVKEEIEKKYDQIPESYSTDIINKIYFYPRKG